jgi:hypothetical protein
MAGAAVLPDQLDELGAARRRGLCGGGSGPKQQRKTAGQAVHGDRMPRGTAADLT